MIHLIFITIAFTNDTIYPSTSSLSRAVLARSRVFVVVVFAPRRQSSTRVMPTDAAPTCVAYDDTRTACIIGTATGELVFRDRASSSRKSSNDATARERANRDLARVDARRRGANARENAAATVIDVIARRSRRSRRRARREATNDA